MLDKDFHASTQVSFRKFLFEKGFKKRFIDEIGQMATLVNYDQSVDSMNAFPGKYFNNKKKTLSSHAYVFL